MSGAIDFGTVAALLAVSATVTALVAWQYGNTAPGKMRGWLGLTAISLELLAAGLAVHWALKNGSDGLFTVLFCAGVIGLAVAKATLLPGIVAAYRQGDKGALAVGSVAAFGAYAVIYLLGAMSGLESDAGKTAQAISQSAPLQAIDAEIATTRERLRNLAGFSDAGQAAKEETALQARAQAQAEKISDLQTALETAQREMAKWANPDCAPKADGRGKPYTVRAAEACAAVQQAQARLDQAQAAAPAGSSYLARHGEYAGVQQHLVALEKRRAEMLTTDNTAAAGLAVALATVCWRGFSA